VLSYLVIVHVHPPLSERIRFCWLPTWLSTVGYGDRRKQLAARQDRGWNVGRRGHGEGSVYRRSRDGKWVGSVELGRGMGGERIRRTVVRASKRAVLDRLDEMRRQAAQGVAPDNARTVAQYLDWWGMNVLPGSVKDSTVDDYRYIIATYVTPHVGRHRLAKLTPEHVQDMMRTLDEAGYSSRTRQYARAVLRRALRWAEQTGLVTRNAAALVDGPKKSGTKLDDTLTATEARAVLNATAGDRLGALAVLVLSLGLRKGEALALRWPDIDLDAGELIVRGTLKRRKGAGLYLDTPKTAAGWRTVPLVGGTVEALREHYRRQLAEQLASPVWLGSGHVFASTIGGPLDARNVTRWWHNLLSRAGVERRRFQATRHTAATLLLDEGVSLEVVSAILGHAGLAITADVYAKVTADSMRRSLAKLDKVLAGP
jgi:integrase